MINDPTLVPILVSLIGYTLIVTIGFALFGTAMSSETDKGKIVKGVAIWFGMYLFLFTSFDALFQNIDDAKGIVCN